MQAEKFFNVVNQIKTAREELFLHKQTTLVKKHKESRKFSLKSLFSSRGTKSSQLKTARDNLKNHQQETAQIYDRIYSSSVKPARSLEETHVKKSSHDSGTHRNCDTNNKKLRKTKTIDDEHLTSTNNANTTHHPNHGREKTLELLPECRKVIESSSILEILNQNNSRNTSTTHPSPAAEKKKPPPVLPKPNISIDNYIKISQEKIGIYLKSIEL